MATQNLTLTYVRAINNNSSHPNRTWFGADPANNLTYGICFSTQLPAGSIDSLTFNIGVIDWYSGIGNRYWNRKDGYAVKISTSNVSTYNSGVINGWDGLLSLNDIWGGAGGTSTITGTISSNSLKNLGGKTVYIYIGVPKGKEGYGDVSYYSAVQIHPETEDLSRNTTVTATYQPYTAVITPTITAQSIIVKPSGSVEVKWSGGSGGTNTAIASYTITLRRGSASGTIVATTKTGVLANSTSTSFTLNSSAIRGDDLYATIQAISNVSGYNGTVNSAKVAVVNSLPAAPSVTKTGSTISSTSNVVFTVSVGSDSNSGQTRSIKYKIDSGTLTSLSGTKLTLNTSSGLSEGNHTIYFYTYDGLECSTAVSQTFSVYVKPAITCTITYQRVASGSNPSDNSLAHKAIISYTLNKTISSPKFYFYFLSSTNSNFSNKNETEGYIEGQYSHDPVNKTITIDITKLGNNMIPYETYFKIGVQVSDGKEWSTWSGNYIADAAWRPALPLPVSSITISNDGTVNKTKNNYFKSQLNLTFTNPAASNTRVDIKEIKIYGYNNSTLLESFSASNINEGVRHTQILTTTKTGFTSFKIETIDKANQVVSTTYTPTVPYYRTSGPSFSAGTFSAPLQFKPYSSSGDFSFSHPVYDYGTGTTESGGTITYIIKIGGETANYNKTVTLNKISDTLWQTTFQNSDFVNFIKNYTDNHNTKHTASISLTITDGFGTSKTWTTSNFTIDFVEKPKFSGGITLKREWSSGTSTSTITITNSVDKKYKMFNPGEKVQIFLPNCSDANGDISNYKIYVYKKWPSNNDTTLPDTGSNPVKPTSAQYDTLLTTLEDTQTSYEYIIPAVSRNAYYYFKVVATDSKGNTAEVLGAQPIYVCRAVAPIFSIIDLKGDSPSAKNLNLTFKIKLSDLGGSSTGSWNKNFYNTFPNLERFGDKLLLVLDIASSENFNNAVRRELNITGSNFISAIENTSSAELTLDSTIPSKIYIRFTLSVPYRKNGSTITYNSSSFTIACIIGEVPTVSHRRHTVAINTLQESIKKVDDAALIVSNFGDSKKTVRFIDTSNDKEIVIDLLAGTISGAIIAGGSW